MEPITVEFRRGVYLPELDLWLDPWDAKERAFVSHAHADHVAPHGQALASAVTKQLVERRFGGKGEIEGHEIGEPFEQDGFRYEMLHAGHILGSAQLRVERILDGASLLYTGDFKLREGISSAPTQARESHTLIMETTYGIPKFHMPPSEGVIRDLVRFCRESLEEGVTPILGAYSLGKAQEVLLTLGKHAPELKFLLHSSAARMTEIHEELGYKAPEWEVLKKDSEVKERVIIAPPNAIRGRQLRNLKPRITCMVTGWGIDPGAKFRYQVDEVFPLSDHADYDDLLRYVEMVNPSRVLTLHGYAGEFARDLRSRGREAWSLTGENQMELTLDAPADTSASGETEVPVEEGADLTGFAGFANVCTRISRTMGKLEKVRILSDYLSALTEEELPIATCFLAGRAFGRTEEVRALNVGWAITRRALLEASGRTEAEYRQLAQGQGDSGRAAFLILSGKTTPEAFPLRDIRSAFEKAAAARGPAEKTAVLREQLRHMEPVEAQFFVKILSRDLRIGLKEGLIEEALATAFDASAKEVRQAHMLTGDLGQTALLARQGRLDEAGVTPFIPVKCMLASPEETAEDIWKRLGEDGGAVWLEDKFDGIRAQLHKVGDRVEIFSRDQRPLHEEFREFAEPAASLEHDVILDGEIIAFAEGKRLTFFDLQKRLGRRTEGDLFFGPSIPVRFVAFDLLWKDGSGMMDTPLEARRKALEALGLPNPFETLAVHRASSVDEVEQAFKAARLRDNEGLIAKDPLSTYSPGRRGLSWLKLKKPMSTLDCVVVAAEQGHGKRSHVLSDYTFALRDTRTEELVVIGKAYTGLTDEEIEDLTEHFTERTISKSRHVRKVEPDTVLEIAFDSIQASKRHNSGLALRFPRIKTIRHDKTPADIDTLEYAQRLAGVKE